MSVEQRMQRVIKDVLRHDDLVLSDEMTAGDVEGWDSLAHINIMFLLESEFGVHFTDEQLNGFRTVGDLRRYLAETAAS